MLSRQLSRLKTVHCGDFGAAYGIGAGDFNGDGHQDLVSTHYGGWNSNASTGSLNVFLSRGNGEFEEPTVYPVNGSASSVAVEDVDGDGASGLGNRYLFADRRQYNLTPTWQWGR